MEPVLNSTVSATGHSPAVTDIVEYLLAFKPGLRERIKQLLGVRQNDCQPALATRPKNCYETAAFVLGLDFRARRETDTQIMNDQEKIAALFSTAGFRKVTEAFVFRSVGRNISGVDPAAIPKNMRAGDLFLFGGRALNSKGREVDRYVHAMVYLGRFQGRYYAFEKPNSECGVRSPYQVIALDRALQETIGQASSYNNIFIDRVFVLRRD